MSLSDVEKALKRLVHRKSEDSIAVVASNLAAKVTEKDDKTIDFSEEDGIDDSSIDSDNAYNKPGLYKIGSSKNKRSVDEPRFFCYEDTFSSNEVSVEVEGIGKLHFPLDEKSIKDMIHISTKAKFGSGEKTLFDTTVRDTQTIPAAKLKVAIDEKALSSVLSRIGAGLNITENDALKPSLYNMLIYGPGQFFKKHSDSEKLPNMIATLVIVLPSSHKGGDLIIQHSNQEHVFFGSQNFNCIKCIAFYSDCDHEIEKVIEGYRVALTYNIVFQSSGTIEIPPLNDSVNNAITKYFQRMHNVRLIFMLSHKYSEHSLRWHMLKGNDRSQALALLAVAKQQNKVAYLALADHQELRASLVYEEGCDPTEVYESTTNLYFWVNEENDIVTSEALKKYAVDEDEVCYSIESYKLEPYNTDEHGPTGNEGANCDFWYRRACVVILLNNWVLPENFKSSLNNLFELTVKESNKKLILEEIKKAGNAFSQYELWKDQQNADKLIKLVVYLESKELAVEILSQLPEQLLKVDKISILAKLENFYDEDTWNKITDAWQETYSYSFMYSYGSNSFDTFKERIKFLQKYKDVAKKGLITKFLLQNFVEKFTNENKRYSSVDKSKSVDAKFCKDLQILLQLCIDMKCESGISMFTDFIKSNYSLAVKVDLLCWLYKNLEIFDVYQMNDLKCIILKDISEKLHSIPDNNDWSMPITLTCNCQFCNQLTQFFKSSKDTKIVIPAATKNRNHILRYLNSLKNSSIKFETLKTGSPHKVAVQKLAKVQIENQNLKQELIKCQNKLQELKFLKKDVEKAADPDVSLKEEGIDEFMQIDEVKEYIDKKPEKTTTEDVSKIESDEIIIANEPIIEKCDQLQVSLHTVNSNQQKNIDTKNNCNDDTKRKCEKVEYTVPAKRQKIDE